MMMIKNARIILEEGVRKGSVLVENGKTKDIFLQENQESQVICDMSLRLNKDHIYDAEGNYLAPGFVDLHTHGAGGYDFMDGDVESIVGAAKTHLLHGTTTLLPTSLSSGDDELFTFIDNYKKATKNEANMPHMPGIHLEGPYFAMSEKGAQDCKYIRNPERSHYEKIMERAEGCIKRWSVAPELEGALEMIGTLSKQGVIMSGGHTAAFYEEIARAYDCGMSMLTHFYSAMQSVRRVNSMRTLGAIEAGYLLDDLYVELICDGMHLPPDLLSFIFKCKNQDHITACTDSMRAAGMPDGPSILGSLAHGQPVIVEDGVAKMPENQCFGGSVATGDRLFRTLKSIGLPLETVAKITSLHGARLLGMEDKIGSIKQGKIADMVIFDENVSIKNVFINGIPMEKVS